MIIIRVNAYDYIVRTRVPFCYIQANPSRISNRTGCGLIPDGLLKIGPFRSSGWVIIRYHGPRGRSLDADCKLSTLVAHFNAIYGCTDDIIFLTRKKDREKKQ